MLQQSCPAVQQNVPQQVSPAPLQVWPTISMHAGMATQDPLSQNGVNPAQTCWQSPQFCGSL